MNKSESVTGKDMLMEISNSLLLLSKEATEVGISTTSMLVVLKHVLTLADVLQRYTHAAEKGKRNATALCFQIEKIVSARIASNEPDDSPLFLSAGAVNNILWLVEYVEEKSENLTALKYADSVLRVTGVLRKHGVTFVGDEEN